MLQRFITFIDRLGDRLNPITVFWLRKQKGWQGIAPLTVFAHLILLACLLFADLLTGPFFEVLRQTYISCLLTFPPLMSFGAAMNGYPVLQKLDPLLFLTPLTERQVRIGFFLTGLVQGFWGWSLIVLIYSYLYALKIVSLEWVLLYPLLSLVVAWMFAAVGTSLSASVKTKWQMIAIFPLYFLPLWLGMMYFFSPSSRLFVIESIIQLFPASIFSSEILLSVFGIALPSYLFVAYRLFDYNLDKSRSFFRKLLVSLGVYFGVMLLLAGIWFALWFAFQ